MFYLTQETAQLLYRSSNTTDQYHTFLKYKISQSIETVWKN